MAIKVFLDTNILLDLLDDERPSHQYAVAIYVAIESGGIDASISETVLTTADYILQKVMTKEKRNSIWQELLQTVSIISCTTKLCISAVQLNHSDFEDALLYQLAIDSELDYFVSNDKGIKKISQPLVPVLNAKEFLNINE